jgi:signal transduction histidine kinase
MEKRSGGAGSVERHIIERQVAHLSRLVDDLLDVSRITKGKIQLERTRVDLRTVIARALELTQPAMERRAEPVRLDLPRCARVRARRCGAARASAVQPSHQRRQVHEAGRAHRAAAARGA